MILNGELHRFAWEVPNYKRIVGTAAAVSFATGGIGGLAYGSTSTDVHGHVRVRFVVKKKESEVAALDKEYEATVTEKKAKLNSDLPKTRRAIVARALKDVMEQFKADLAEVTSKGVNAAAVDSVTTK